MSDGRPSRILHTGGCGSGGAAARFGPAKEGAAGVTGRAAADALESADRNPDLPHVLEAQGVFRKLSTGEVASALFNLEVAANATLVDVGTRLLRSPLMRSRLLAAPVLFGLKRTAYAHFCAGETVDEAARTLERMWELGLHGILDFSVEDALTAETCEQNLAGFLKSIAQTAQLPPGSVSYACVKVTALGPLAVLEKASNLLRWQHTHPSFALRWALPSLPVLASESPDFYVQEMPEALTPEEEKEMADCVRRMRAVCDACVAQRLPLLVDAEYTSVTPAVDHIGLAAALEFNQGNALPRVYTTVQCYLQDALPRLKAVLVAAEQQGVSCGFKLVRGAYLSRENEFAKAMGAESPVHPSLEATHACYDACAAHLVEAAARSPHGAAVVLATHNYASGRNAVLKAAEVGLPKDDPRLHFAQLKGMADGLSLGLSFAGYNVSKYLPYGPVLEVMPYLLRRAEENSQLLGSTLPDRKRLRKELRERLASIFRFRS